MNLVETHPTLVFALSVFSVACFVGSLLALPVLVARAPVDYFVHEGTGRTPRSLSLRIARNIAGVVLLLAGVLMLVLPGQGLLTILLSVTLLDLPGKQRLVKAIGMRPGVSKGLQWLRARAGKPPFELP